MDRKYYRYIENGCLCDLIQREGPISEKNTCKYIEHVLTGLEYLHHQGVVHRDIKAANLLLNGVGVCKLSDFGLSISLNDLNNITVVNIFSPLIGRQSLLDSS